MQKNTLQIRDRLLAGLDKEYNVVNVGVVVDVLSQLESIQITKEALEATRLGKHVNELRRKSKDRQIANRAKSLVKKWRDLFVQQQQQQQQQQQPPPSSSSASSSNGEPPPGGGGGYKAPLVNGNHRTSPSLPAAASSAGVGAKVSPRCSIRVASSSLPSSASTSPALSRPTTPVSGGGGAGVGTASTLNPSQQQQQQRRRHSYGRSCPVSPAVGRPGQVNGLRPGKFAKRPKSESDEFVDVESVDAAPPPPPPPPPPSKRQRTNGYHRTTSPNICDNSDDVDEKVPPVDRQPPRGPGKAASAAAAALKRNVRRGKVRTTQELVQELQRTRVLSPKGGKTTGGGEGPVTQLDESKEELMNRFFESQEGRGKTDDAVPSSPTILGVSSPPSEPTSTTAVPEKEKDSVEDVLAQLPPIDATAILAELQLQSAGGGENDDDEDDGFEMEGLIPVPKPAPRPVIVTDDMVNQLNEDQRESFNGNFSHNGEFKEWHEVVSKPSLGGDLLHILPYSIID